MIEVNFSLLNISVFALADLILLWYFFKYKDRCNELEERIKLLEKKVKVCGKNKKKY